jgi:hypothetical protein
MDEEFFFRSVRVTSLLQPSFEGRRLLACHRVGNVALGSSARPRLAPPFRRKPTILPRRMSKSSRSRGWNQCRFTHFLLGFALVSAGAGSLASCASMAQLPVSAGGMPQDAPKRPQIAPAFPAVHDMPPPRKSAVLTEEEKKRVEAELAVVRAQQARRAQSSKSDPDW